MGGHRMSPEKSGGYNLDDYVDVAERIGAFAKKYPDGSLQSELKRMDDGWLCKAKAYRTPDDLRPGIGHAFEQAPGKTPYTRDSEAMNAETSAWGRAIVALGFQTKKIASRNEVRARQNNNSDSAGEPQAVENEKTLSTPVSAASAAVDEQPSPAEPPITNAQKKKLDFLVGKLRGPHLVTSDLYAAVGAEPVLDENGIPHWGPLRDRLSRVQASDLIDRLDKHEKKLAEQEAALEPEPVASRKAGGG
jgi:hypothetical protein